MQFLRQKFHVCTPVHHVPRNHYQQTYVNQLELMLDCLHRQEGHTDETAQIAGVPLRLREK